MAAWKKIVQHDTDATLTSLDASGNITADTFTGDGSGLTNLPAGGGVELSLAQNVIIPPQGFSTPIPDGTTNPGSSEWWNGPGTSRAFTYDDASGDDGETPSTTTGADYGGVSAVVAPNMLMYPWGSGNGGGNPSAFVFTEASGITGVVHQIRTPYIEIPGEHQARLVFYFFAAGADMGSLKIKHSTNATNATSDSDTIDFKYYVKSTGEFNTHLSGSGTPGVYNGPLTGNNFLQAHSANAAVNGMAFADRQQYKAWSRCEAVVPANGYVYIEFTTGTTFNSDFCIDNAYVVSTKDYMDSGTPDGFDANVVLQSDADLNIAVGLRTYENDYNASKVLVKATDEVHFKGDVVAYSSTISDERLKENILPITNSLSVIKNIQGVSYDWKYKPTTRQVGLLAQQVESQIPEVVKEYDLPFTGGPKSDTPYKTVSYQLLVPHLIEAIKELNARIEDLESLLDK